MRRQEEQKEGKRLLFENEREKKEKICKMKEYIQNHIASNGSGDELNDLFYILTVV